GSSHAAANARTASVTAALAAGTRWAGIRVAFATGPTPTVAEGIEQLRAHGARRITVAPWFIAPGRITDRVAAAVTEAGLAMSEPLGAHQLVAATVLDRFDQAIAQRRAA
ncbi:MAG: CbiX/SirB N-terminal domain-containing protein, partial [Mycobacterium sp.]